MRRRLFAVFTVASVMSLLLYVTEIISLFRAPYSNGELNWVIVASGILPFAWLGMWLERVVDRTIPRPGQCPSCRYNLTGNTSGVCPERGSEIVRREEVEA